MSEGSVPIGCRRKSREGRAPQLLSDCEGRQDLGQHFPVGRIPSLLRILLGLPRAPCGAALVWGVWAPPQPGRRGRGFLVEMETEGPGGPSDLGVVTRF